MALIYTEAPERAEALLDGIEATLDDERRLAGEAPHVSDVIYCLKKSWRQRQAGYVRVPEAFNQRLVLLVGQALHAIQSKARDSRTSNVSLRTSWLVGEADSIRIDQDGLAVEEFKTTRTGTATPAPEKWPHYVEQLAAYLVLVYAAYNQFVLRGILHVIHLTFNPTRRKDESWDDYQARIAADKHLRSYDLQFTTDELDKWGVELRRRATLVSGAKEPSAAGEHYSWECQYCPFSAKFGGNCGEEEQFRPASFFTTEVPDAV